MNTKQKTILAVDDDRDILVVVEKILKAAGFNVILAQSPMEARKYLDTDIPHLILSDLNMEPEDGYSFINSLRKQSKFQSTPIIVLSAVNEFNAVKRVIGLGVTDYVVKPIVASLLIRKIKKAMFNLEFTSWVPEAGQEPSVSLSLEAKIIAMGETGYKLAGPFKLESGERVKLSCNEFSAMGMENSHQQVTPKMKTYLSGGFFSNEVTFIGIGEGEASRIRTYLRKGSEK